MQVGSHLRLLRALGQGGMGSVWLAEHTALRTQVAVKFLRDMYVDHPLAVVRLQREAEAAARIQSPHVVRVFDLGFTEQGVPYIVMEHLEGRTLHDLVERRRRLTLNETVSILRQLGAALARAHEAGIVHRDIKPENVFLVEGEPEPFVKVLDFGIAKNTVDEAERLTVTGAIMGTPHFMSPEQMAGGARVGPHSDLWALGVVAYFCLTGQTPFNGATIAAVAVAIDRGPPPPPSRLAPGVPPAIDAWVLSLLEPDPARRPQSARAVLEALDAALAGLRGPRAGAGETEIMPARDSLTSGEGFPSLVTTLMPLATIGAGSPQQRARARTWAVAAAAVMGISTLAWAGASGVARSGPAERTAQRASLAMLGSGPAAGTPAAVPAAAAAPAPAAAEPAVAAAAAEPAAACATSAPQPEVAPQREVAPRPEATAKAPQPEEASPSGAPTAPGAAAVVPATAVAKAAPTTPARAVAKAAPTTPAKAPIKKIANRAHVRRDLGF